MGVDRYARIGPPHRPAPPFPWRHAFALTLLAVAGTALTLPYSLQLAVPSPIRSGGSAPSPAVLIYGVAVEAVVTFVVVAVGLRLGRPLGFDWTLIQGWHDGDRPALLRRCVVLGATLGVLAAMVLLGFSMLLPLPELGALRAPSWHAALLASFGAGLREEIWFRLGVMTLLAWSFSLGGRAGLVKLGIISANIAAAVLFGMIHLPQAAAFGVLTAPIIAWILIGNGLVGVVCGWLYWRVGILAAIVSHTSTDIVLKVLYPLFTTY